ncbi:hypothetical protein [Streptomyces bauhiniae]|uniref:Uncharacterized protein n=1 Tax=Streptomyces bauhiniae TaxID=2340725 RepID=A0A7K3QRA4_9ACTN|nr:hypothetical protein [Streptomyces bauhiniae]NEB92428.1 hypothetical protein [Streptomyces bauhiniae]
MNRPTWPTLTTVTVAGLLAAFLAVIGTSSALAGVAAYAAVVSSLAHAMAAPVTRTVGASVLVVVTTLILTLRACRTLIDAALWLLTTGREGALHTVKATA